MTLFNFGQMGPKSGGFFATAGDDAATPIGGWRMFLGRDHDHNQSVDGSASSASSLSIGTGLRTFALTDQRPGLAAAGNFVVARSYAIVTPGDTDFTTIGAADSDAGTVFTATGVGSGTGTALDIASFLSVFYVGKRIRCYSSEIVWVEGPITAAAWDSITINADLTSGSGVHDDWYVNAVAGGSWVQLFDSLGDDGNADFIARVVGWDYAQDVAQASSISDGGIGFAGASRTTAALDGLGVAGFAINRDHGFKAWGAYFDAVSTSLSSGITHGIEINATALHPSAMGGLTPYNVFTPRMTGIMNLAVGSDRNVFGASNPIDWVRMCQSNGGQAFAGDVWRDGLLVRGGDNYGRAVSMPWMYGLSWYSQNTGGGAGQQQEVVRIFSGVANSAIRWRMSFTDGSFAIDEGVGAGASLFRVNWRDDATSHVFVDGGSATTLPIVGVGGPAADISLRLQPKGSGGLIVPLASIPNFAGVAAALESTTIGIGRVFRVGTELHIKTEQT